MTTKFLVVTVDNLVFKFNLVCLEGVGEESKKSRISCLKFNTSQTSVQST